VKLLLSSQVAERTFVIKWSQLRYQRRRKIFRISNTECLSIASVGAGVEESTAKELCDMVVVREQEASR
jgi:hypothetical protein